MIINRMVSIQDIIGMLTSFLDCMFNIMSYLAFNVMPSIPM